MVQWSRLRWLRATSKSLFARDQFDATVSGLRARMTSSNTRLMDVSVNSSRLFAPSGSLPTTFQKEQRLHSNGMPMR
jgi:hypothetical protein